MNTYALLSAQLLLWMISSSEGFVPAERPVIAGKTALLSTSSSSSSSSDNKSHDPVEMARLSLEMHWVLEETKEDCLVDDPASCGSEECPECDGKGHTVCRFCRGTSQMYINGSFSKCPVCDNGIETCHSCAGTGRIAEWTKLSGNDHESNSEDGMTLRP